MLYDSDLCVYFHLCHFTITPPYEITVMTVPFVTPRDLDPPHDDALDSHPEFLFLCYAFMYTGFWRPVASMCLGSVVLPAYACKIKDFIIIIPPSNPRRRAAGLFAAFTTGSITMANWLMLS